MAGVSDRGELFESWKEIAAHLRRNVRTCQMWERELGLPVHRLDGSPKARVFAYRDELDRWLDEKLHEREREAADQRPIRESGGAARQAAGVRKTGDRHAGLPSLPRWNKGLIAGLAILALAAVGALAWLLGRQAKIRWANDVAIPEIEGLFLSPDQRRAFDLAVQAEKALPKSPRLARLWPRISGTLKVETDPPGAEFYVRHFRDPGGAWEPIGRTPISGRRLPQGHTCWKALRPDCAPAEGVVLVYPGLEEELRIILDAAGAAPPGMVRIAGGPCDLPQYQISQAPAVKLGDFWIDQYEVTNSQFKVFVDAGGYANPNYWKHPFKGDGGTMSLDAAKTILVDRTGRPGPGTWEAGTYPPGTGDQPVTGVSWYEAAAYAEFASKQLPSVYHWNLAAGLDRACEYLIPASNIEGRGLASVGSFGSLGPFGTYDMVGNAGEWCLNEADGKRALLGGSWKDAQSLFNIFFSYPPFARADDFGFRCIKSIGNAKEENVASGQIPVRAEPEYAERKPCSEEVFEAYRALYAFTKTELDARIQSRQDWSEDTTVEMVSIIDASGGDRIPIYIFTPRKTAPPFQSVVYFPGSSARYLDSVFEYGPVKNREVELFTRSGRAFVFPVYWDTFVRQQRLRPPRTRQYMKDRIIRHHRELVRCLDYLETRPDFDKNKIAYQGSSWGAWAGPIHLALEKRFKAANFIGAGFYWEMYSSERGSPEWDVINFLPRVRAPILMQNGRYDIYFPLETNAGHFFRFLGTPDKDKRLRIYPTGHAVEILNSYRRDLFEFLDAYLGPVGNAGLD